MPLIFSPHRNTPYDTNNITKKNAGMLNLKGVCSLLKFQSGDRKRGPASPLFFTRRRTAPARVANRRSESHRVMPALKRKGKGTRTTSLVRVRVKEREMVSSRCFERKPSTSPQT